jgi:hypothetical protein
MYMREHDSRKNEGFIASIDTVTKSSTSGSGMRSVRAFVNCTAATAATVMAKVLLARRGDRWHRNQPPRQQVSTADACRRDSRDCETLSDYMQLLVDERKLLRREY